MRPLLCGPPPWPGPHCQTTCCLPGLLAASAGAESEAGVVWARGGDGLPLAGAAPGRGVGAFQVAPALVLGGPAQRSNCPGGRGRFPRVRWRHGQRGGGSRGWCPLDCETGHANAGAPDNQGSRSVHQAAVAAWAAAADGAGSCQCTEAAATAATAATAAAAA